MFPRTLRVMFVTASMIGTVFCPQAQAGFNTPTLEECEAQAQKAPDNPMSWYCFNLAVGAYGRYDEAVRLLDGHLALNPNLHRARFHLALIEQMRGHPRADRLLREAVDGMEKAGDFRGVTYGALSLAFRLGEQGRLDDADRELERGHRAALATGNAEMLARVQTGQAIQAGRRADTGKALRLFREAEKKVFPQGPPDLQGRILSGLGQVYWYFEEYGQALRIYEREIELWRRVGDIYSLAGPMYNAALMAGKLAELGQGTKDDYQQRLHAALEISLRTQNHAVEAGLRILLGQGKQGPAAIAEFERAVDLATKTDDMETRLLATRLLGTWIAWQGPATRDAGFRLYDQAIEEAKQKGSLFNLARGMLGRAHLAMMFEPRETAIRWQTEALEAVERIRALQPEAAMRALVLGRWDYAYYRLAGFVLDTRDHSPEPQEDLALAFHTLERLRARTLLEALEGTGKTPEAATLEGIQRALPEDQALLAFALPGPDQNPEYRREVPSAWLLVVTTHQANAFRIPARGILQEQVRIFEGLFANRDGSEARAATRLYRDLLEDALQNLPPSVKRLILIPDGPLHRVPFEALRSEPERKPLALHYEIEYAPSAALWIRFRKTEGWPKESKVLAFAAPEISGEGSPDTQRAADPRIKESPLSPLPFARGEARAIVRRLGGGTLLTGAQASESFLKQADLAPFGLIHFATHAVVDEVHPERSAVLLSPGSSGEDGLLQFREIVDLHLESKVVVLSACRSASGPVARGEGVIGLARAFFCAGSRAVVGSLWPLQDDEAKEFAEAFADQLALGRSLSAALTTVRRDRIKSGAPAAAWASIIVLGDGDFIPYPGGIPHSALRKGWPLVVLVPLLFAAAFFLIRLTRHPRLCSKIR